MRSPRRRWPRPPLPGSRAFNLYPVLDLFLNAGYRRVDRKGVVEFFPNTREGINLYELNPVVSRFIGPDKLVDSLDKKLSDEEHGRVRLHFYPFGALTASAEWINQYDAMHS